jgi:hypothetical protein
MSHRRHVSSEMFLNEIINLIHRNYTYVTPFIVNDGSTIRRSEALKVHLIPRIVFHVIHLTFIQGPSDKLRKENSSGVKHFRNAIRP